MYDIHFILPVSVCKPEYAVRVVDFKNYGLLNVKDKKCLVSFLVGTENIECNGGWRENVDVQIIPSAFDDAAQKVYDYLAGAKAQARWTAKIDDDSVTDVAGLVDNLDQGMSDANLYLCASMCKDEPGQCMIEKNILHEMGVTWYSNAIRNRAVWHEVEASVVSHRAFKAIENCSQAQTFLKKRSMVKNGVTDIAWACAARLAGVHIADCTFLTRYPLVGNFSYFGGSLNHIHLVKRHGFGFSDSTNNNALNFIEKRLNCKSEEAKLIENQEYLFSHPGKLLGILKFKSNGGIDGSVHPNESIWMIEDEKLKIFNHEGNVTSWYPLDNINKMVGRFVQNDSILTLQRLLS